MDKIKIDGILLTPLKIIPHPQGDIFHMMKKSDAGFCGFGEAYFTTVKFGEIKAWRKHSRMTLNLAVPAGEVKFVMFDDRKGSKTKGSFIEVILSPLNYKRLTIPPGIWTGFKGLSDGLNLVLDVADLEHDPSETERADIGKFAYGW